MKILAAQETAALLPYPALAAELRAVLADRRAGRATAPPRLPLPLAGGGLLLLMPAADEAIAITKIVTVHPGNAGHGLPSIQAEVLVCEAATGRRLLWLDGATVTARRTAALSLLAAQALAPNPAGPLLIVGAGTQGRAHLAAFTEGLGVREVYVVSRTPAHAVALAAEARAAGLAAEAVAHPADVLDRVSLIVTATTSADPVLPAAVRPDAFIAAIGAYRPDHAELPPALVRRAHLVVDTLEGAQAEAGDLIRAGIDWSGVTPLEEALAQPRPAGGPVVFKSVGHALWDLAAARLAWRTLDGGHPDGPTWCSAEPSPGLSDPGKATGAINRAAIPRRVREATLARPWGAGEPSRRGSRRGNGSQGARAVEHPAPGGTGYGRS